MTLHNTPNPHPPPPPPPPKKKKKKKKKQQKKNNKIASYEASGISPINDQQCVVEGSSCTLCNFVITKTPVSVAQLDAPSDWRPGGRGFNPRRGRQHSFVEIDHEIFSTVILSLPLIQEGQLSVSGERMCTILVNRLED